MTVFESNHYWALLRSDKKYGHWLRWHTHPTSYWKRAALHHKLYATLIYDRTLIKQHKHWVKDD
jgi:hypothetical protein